MPMSTSNRLLVNLHAKNVPDYKLMFSRRFFLSFKEAATKFLPECLFSDVLRLRQSGIKVLVLLTGKSPHHKVLYCRDPLLHLGWTRFNIDF